MSENVAVIVTGDRHAKWDDWMPVVDLVLTDIERVQIGFRTVVIHGWANGIDRIADAAADRPTFSTLAMPAQWDTDGNAAGPKRNEQMMTVLLALAAVGYDIRVLAFHNDLSQSRGTAHMVRIARAAGVPVEVYNQRGGVDVMTTSVTTSDALYGRAEISMIQETQTTMNDAPRSGQSLTGASTPEAMTYLAWYDGGKKRSVRDKLADAVDRYREKTGDDPTIVFLSYADAEAMTDGSPAARAAVRFEQPLDVGGTQLSARAVGSLSRGTFYLGRVGR